MSTHAAGSAGVGRSSVGLSAEDLLGYNVPGKRVELVRGQLTVREPAGVRHGSIGMRVGYAVLSKLEQTTTPGGVRGLVIGADSGFILHRNPDTVRAANMAFVSAEKFVVEPTVGDGEFAPDLVVEVTSRNDRAGAVLTKVGEWLSAGAQLVWVIDPARRTAAVYRADGSVSVLDVGASLAGDDVLPGFALPLTRLFTAV